MASLSKTIAGRITLGVLAVHLLVLPTLYFGMVYLLKQSNEDVFLNGTRGHTRFLADSLERIGDVSSESAIIEVLDSVVLSGNGVFSELAGGSRLIRSSLISDAEAGRYQEDFEIGENGDDVYYISVPVVLDQATLNLRVGFDEMPYREQNKLAYRNGLAIIAVYILALLLMLPLIGRRVVRPIKAIQKASRAIASGAFSEHLVIDTDLVEFVDLSHDLDRMKDRLIGISAQLEQQIQEREEAESHRRILEQQLRHSQRLETVGTMAGGIAHELNNILVPIILYSDTAIEDLPENSPIREDIKRVLNAATRAKSIVSQVLTFGRKTAASDHEPVDMAAAVRESVELLQVSMPPSVELDAEITAGCPMVLGDAALINQLILNLCTNAWQSLENAQGTVSMSLDIVEVGDALAEKYPSLGQDQCIRLIVGDNGQGMTAETLERVFEPFFTTRAVGEGTGLGLSVVHGIVTDMNGAIDVKSALDLGSTIIVYLPAVQQESTSQY